MLTPFQAVVWAGLFNVVAIFIFDLSVGNTIAKTVNTSAIDLWVILAGLLAATAWNLFTWALGLPSSSSHTLIGGFAGAAMAYAANDGGFGALGFGVLKTEEVLKPLLFIFLAPVIGGLIAFIIALVTIQRNYIKKMFFAALGSFITVFASWFYKDVFEIKIQMIWIIGILLGLFLIVYIIYQLVYGKRQSALRESSMYKKLQLLSSAAFSIGHGGADSQKVIGIICAALLVYSNMEREGKVDVALPDSFKVSEIFQIKYEEDGNVKKFKPQRYGEINGRPFMLCNDTKLFDVSKGEKIKVDESHMAIVDGKEVDVKEVLVPFEIYSKTKRVEKDGKMKDETSIYDLSNDSLVFKGGKINKNWIYASVFKDFLDEKGKLKESYKIESKFTRETTPYWVVLACYLAIGIGTLMGGWKIVKTMGTKITKVTPLEGVCAETAGALTLFTVSQFGIPVSTTHTITGSIIGVGATKRLSAVRWGVTINLLWAWILTIPVSAILAAAFYHIILLVK
ncbi:MAG: inorganic phosphate transporter [Bacteroidetes bacterium]|nr:inorganic phosphate transporter [Bacteroidota bacterium]